MAAYSTAALATAVLADRADGEVVPYNPPGGPLVLHNGNGGTVNEIFLDIYTGDATYEYRLYSYFGFTIQTQFNENPDDLVLWIIQYFAAVVPAGETIGPLSSPWENYGYMDQFTGMRGYLGIQFDIPDSSPHFGYLDIGIDQAGQTLTVYGGAYESLANTAITTPVPEPGGLALLAAGAAGLAAWRQRRKREQAS
ncbi:MAG: PEP-CTERM sorting domain-containing protein [Pirellulales bacterium]